MHFSMNSKRRVKPAVVLGLFLAAYLTLVKAAVFINEVDGNLEDVEVVVDYSWDSSGRDLDTATTFLSQTGGFGCTPTGEFVTFKGDVRTQGGTETSIVHINDAKEQDHISDRGEVNFFAGWVQESTATARLSVSLRNAVTKVVIDGSTFGGVIFPGTQNGSARCATEPTGFYVVEQTGEGRLFISYATQPRVISLPPPVSASTV